MTLPHIAATEAKTLLDKGARLIDVREESEFARERIPGAANAPLSTLSGPLARSGSEVIVFHCLSGARTRANAGRLREAAGCTAYVMDGGIAGWKAAGLPVEAGGAAGPGGGFSAIRSMLGLG